MDRGTEVPQQALEAHSLRLCTSVVIRPGAGDDMRTSLKRIARGGLEQSTR